MTTGFFRRLVAVLAAALLFGVFSPSAWAQARCTDALQEAEDKFALGDDEAVISLLSGCVSQNVLPEGRAVPIFRLLAQANLRVGDERQATMALVRLLEVDPSYEPDPDRDSRTYGAFVGDVKSVLQLPSRAAYRCDREMATAQMHYDEGTLSETITALDACIAKPEVDTAETVRAYRMLALTHLRLGALADARDAIMDLLALAPDYEADPVHDIPSYTSLVGIVRQQLAGEQAP